MSLNQQRLTGRPSNYKFDRGGMPAEFGPYSGEVMNNVDPTRSGRLQVYIEQFAGPDNTIKSKWITVSYCPPFGGATPKTSTSTGPGTYGSTNNQQSYGMAQAAPDLGSTVLCFFVAGDPNQGFYMGVIPGQGINSMVPAIGAVKNPALQNENQNAYFAKSPQLPVTEINNAPTNTEINDSPQFYKKPKPVHSYVAAGLFQAGTVNDPIRGPITTSAQRESPSAVTGLSSPGRPVYQGGMNDATVKKDAAANKLKPEDVNVVGRKGGHSFVLDDGDVSGTNSMVRIRTAKGHQITMSDDGNCFYITHANGQVWLEFGQEGTLDVYATNSINLRTQGTMNLHADEDFNIYAGGNINMKSKKAMNVSTEAGLTLSAKAALTLYSQATIGVKTTGELKLDGGAGSWLAKGSLTLQSGQVQINPGSAPSVPVPDGLVEYTMPDAKFDTSTGWDVNPTGLKSIVTRAPSHEPWPYHNQGVNVKVKLSNGSKSTPPGAPNVPAGTKITKTK
jgi:hypothetical protein